MEESKQKFTGIVSAVLKKEKKKLPELIEASLQRFKTNPSFFESGIGKPELEVALDFIASQVNSGKVTSSQIEFLTVAYSCSNSSAWFDKACGLSMLLHLSR